MVPLVIQWAGTSSTATATTATVQNSSPAGSAAGNVAYVFVGYNWTTSDPGVTVSDSANGAYTQVGSATYNVSGGDNGSLYVFQRTGILGSAQNGNTITATWGGTNFSNLDLNFLEVAGANYALPTFTSQSYNTSTASPLTVGPVTTTTPNQLLIAYVLSDQAYDQSTIPAPWQTIAGTMQGELLQQFSAFVSGVSQTASFPLTGSGGGVTAIIQVLSAPKFIQQNSSSTASSATTLTAAYSAIQWAGDALVVYVSCSIAGDVSSVTDTALNLYTLVDSKTNGIYNLYEYMCPAANS